jgi:hypothetical protein
VQRASNCGTDSVKRKSLRTEQNREETDNIDKAMPTPFLPDITGGMKTKVHRVKSKKNIRDPDSARVERLHVVNSKHATVSAKRKVGLHEELQLIKGKYENQCFKKGSKQKKSERQARVKMEQYNWKSWLNKRNGKTTTRLTKREFQVFWGWYSSRREINHGHNEELGGIRLDRAADDFVHIGLFDNRPAACVFLKGVDTDDSGYISFSELMEALGDASDESQVICMRTFVASLTEKQDGKKKEAAKKADNLRRLTMKKCATVASGMGCDSAIHPKSLPKIDEHVTVKRMNSC